MVLRSLNKNMELTLMANFSTQYLDMDDATCYAILRTDCNKEAWHRGTGGMWSRIDRMDKTDEQ